MTLYARWEQAPREANATRGNNYIDQVSRRSDKTGFDWEEDKRKTRGRRVVKENIEGYGRRNKSKRAPTQVVVFALVLLFALAPPLTAAMPVIAAPADLVLGGPFKGEDRKR